MMHQNLISANMILYCKEWDETVRFYRDGMGLPVLFSTDWFVEFGLSAAARLSIADERHASIKSCGSAGITVALQVDDIDSARTYAEKMGLKPTAVKRHPWDARVFYLFDPEGHRLEIWESLRSDEAPELSLHGP
jgi:catechol 2,3-dioxygenase-like lactoylglutathione lyase family enzyme